MTLGTEAWMILLATLAIASQPVPDGTKIRATTQCFSIVRGNASIGATFQQVKPVRFTGRKAWDVVVHQRLANGAFDLRDHFVLDGKTLAPIAFDSKKMGIEHVRLVYSNGRVTGKRTEKGEQFAIDQPTPSPVWEGNLWGVTFGAMPLSADAQFTLPFFQYDQGFGAFTLRVTGTDLVDTPVGRVTAWTVDAGVDSKRRVTYLIDQATGAELGTRGSGFATRLGGDCTGLD